MKKICMFPGQGSQKVQMGKSFYDNFQIVKDLFAEADETLKTNITKIIFEDENSLKKTIYSQPALLLVSYSIFKVLVAEFGLKVNDFSYTLGHSLGEYSALTVCGTFSFTDALKLLQLRASSMESAVPNNRGGMLAVLGLTCNQIEALKIPGLEIANNNSSLQVVLSGMKEFFNNAIEILTSNGAKRIIPLEVSGPFHSSYMQPAADALKQALKIVNKHNPEIPIISNVTAQPSCNINEIIALLEMQVVRGVRWFESMQFLQNESVEVAVEIGSGKVLSNLLKRTAPEIKVINIESYDDIQNAIPYLT